VLPSNAPQEKELIFFPYWRFKGMLFSCLRNGIQHRFVDASHQAIDSHFFPPSVGLRAQALKLRFATHETAARFLKTRLPINDVLDILDKRFSAALPKSIILQSRIGDTTSLIYSPFYIDNKIHDAVLNQPVSTVLPDNFDMSLFQDDARKWAIEFLPTICPHCGWDLKGERDSLVLNCSNCASVWKPEKDGFAKLSTAYMPDQGENLIYLPFWRIKADVEGIALTSYADLIRAANLPKAVQKGMEEVRFHFWALAFKVRPQNFLRLSRIITISQPLEKPAGGVPKARLHPVTLPLQEGLESLKLTLASFIKPQKKVAEILPDIAIKPKSFILVYLPFHEKHHELIQPKLSMTINKNMLAHSKNL
jgi:hypothetical protein